MNNKIKLAAVALLLAGTAVMANPFGGTNNDNEAEAEARANNRTNVNVEQNVIVIAPAGQNGTNGTNGTNGVNGTNGTNGTAGNAYDFSKFKVAASAMNSVELNPDHEGFSVSVGASAENRHYAGAIGGMYSIKMDGEDPMVDTIGINVKAYNAEAGYVGASVGVTVGF